MRQQEGSSREDQKGLLGRGGNSLYSLRRGKRLLPEVVSTLKSFDIGYSPQNEDSPMISGESPFCRATNFHTPSKEGEEIGLEISHPGGPLGAFDTVLV